MRNKSIFIDKSKFNFLLERMDNKYSYDEYEKMSKTIITESYRGKILKAIANIDEPALVKRLKGFGLDIKEIEDVVNGIGFVKDPTNINNRGFAPLIVDDSWLKNLQKGLELDEVDIRAAKSGLKQLSDLHNSKLKSIQNKRNPVLEYTLDNKNLTVDETIENVKDVLEDYPTFFDDAIETPEYKFENNRGTTEDWIYNSLDDGSAGPGKPSQLMDKKTRGDWMKSRYEYNKIKSEPVKGSDGKPIDTDDLGGTEETGPMIIKKKIKKMFTWAIKDVHKWYWDFVIYGGKKGKLDPEKWFSKRKPGGLNFRTSGDVKKGITIGTYNVTVAKVANYTLMPAVRGLVAHPYALAGFIVECVYKLGWEEDKIIKFENALDNNQEPKEIAIPFKLGNCFGVPSTYVNLETGKVETYDPMMFPLFGWAPTPKVTGWLGLNIVGAGVSMLLEPLNPMVGQLLSEAEQKIDSMFNDLGFLELLHTKCTDEDMKNIVNTIISKTKTIGDNNKMGKFFAKWVIGFDLDNMSEEDTDLFLSILGSVDGGIKVFKEMKEGIDPYIPEGKNKENVNLKDVLLAYCNKKRIDLLSEMSGTAIHKKDSIVIKTEVGKNTNKVLCDEFKWWKMLSCPLGADLDNCKPSESECMKNKVLMEDVVAMANKANKDVNYVDTMFDINQFAEGCTRFNKHYNEDIGDWVCKFPADKTPNETEVDGVFEMEYEDIEVNTSANLFDYKWETALEFYTLNSNNDKVRSSMSNNCSAIQTEANRLNVKNLAEKGVPLFSNKVAWKDKYNYTWYDIRNDEVLNELLKDFCVNSKINNKQKNVESCKKDLSTIFKSINCSYTNNPNI